MTDSGFRVGIEFDSVLGAISKQIYETPLAFIRENVQNAVDALRIQAVRDGIESLDESLAVRIAVRENECVISENGVGMTLGDLRNLFWTIGASGKRTPEAMAAGCVGMFGIGGFANLGVCDSLRVVSQSPDESGHWTELSRSDIEGAAGAVPMVRSGVSDEAAPRGTIVRGSLSGPVDVAALRAYVQEFVRYAQEHVYFNGDLLSRQPFQIAVAQRDGATRISEGDDLWSHASTEVGGAMFETQGHTLLAELRRLETDGDEVRLAGWLRFENGPIEVFKRGFKICSTSIPSQIGVSGVLDCDRLSPTAGRDSLDADSAALVAAIGASMERAAVLHVLDSPDRIAQHTRVFKYVRSQGLVDRLGNVTVELADGSELSLEDVRRLSDEGIRVFHAAAGNREISQLLHARGHVVVQLPSDRHKQSAVRDFLTTYCSAETFEGRIECAETYDDLTLFERAFLSELEQTVISGYDVRSAMLVAGRLTQDVPVFASESEGGELTIYVDVRHPEVAKLEQLGVSPLLMSLVAAFCREYLGPALRSRSPKFFGSGAVNVDWLAKKRSELWVLVTDDIHVFRQGSQRHVVTASDVQVVHAGGRPADVIAGEGAPGEEPKLVRIDGGDDFTSMSGYYLRVPTSASTAYGDVILQCEARAAVWAANRVVLVASDTISTAFQFEIHLDRLVATDAPAGPLAGGALEIERPLQSLFGGLYFPIPAELEPFLVPGEREEIRLEVRCDWVDFVGARAWEARSDV